jgi:phage tail-like protein
MPKGFVTNAHRVDPYKNFKFRVVLDGKVVLGVSKVSALKRTTEVVKHRDGGDNSTDFKSPGRTSYEAVTLERGITHDPQFEAWANLVHRYNGDPAMDLVNYKKPLTLEVMNEKGHVAKRYFLYNCWVSEYTAIPDLDANANAIAIENIKLELEGWERDLETKEPNEASAVPASA